MGLPPFSSEYDSGMDHDEGICHSVWNLSPDAHRCNPKSYVDTYSVKSKLWSFGVELICERARESFIAERFDEERRGLFADKIYTALSPSKVHDLGNNQVVQYHGRFRTTTIQRVLRYRTGIIFEHEYGAFDPWALGTKWYQNQLNSSTYLKLASLDAQSPSNPDKPSRYL